MRKNERMLKERREIMPEKCKKVDTTINGDAGTLVELHKDIEKQLYPLRINSRTVIYVTKDKCNAAYAKEYAEKHQIGSVNPHAKKKTLVVDKERIAGMIVEGKTQKEIAKELGVSVTTVRNYIKELENLGKTNKNHNFEL